MKRYSALTAALLAFAPVMADEPSPFDLGPADTADIDAAIERARVSDDWALSAPAARVSVEGLGEVWRIDSDIFAGTVPPDAAGFRELKRLGVETVISIDLAPPDAAAAREAGIFAFHVPMPAGPVDVADQAYVDRVLSYFRKNYYIHAGPGETRSVAPAALAAQWYEQRYTGGLRAMRILHSAEGAEPDASQWKSVLGPARRLDTETVTEHVPMWWETRVAPEPLAPAMQRIGRSFDALRELEENGWTAPRHMRGTDAVAEANIVHSTLKRRAELNLDGDAMSARMMEAAAAAEALAAQLAVSGDARGEWQALQNACMSCHSEFRD